MNKAELIEALAEASGRRKTATAALERVLEEIQRAVTKGERSRSPASAFSRSGSVTRARHATRAPAKP